MKDVEDLSKGRISFSTGTLYGALRRLLDQCWIQRSESDATEESGRQRKEYTLTDLGRRILKAETNRLQSLAAISQQRLGKIEGN